MSLAFLQGIMVAEEAARAPVILSLAESHFEYIDIELMMPEVEAAAKRATVPVAIHFDHGASQYSAVRAINLGCNGVMVDASHKPLQDNFAISGFVKMALGCGVSVEGELGHVPGVEGWMPNATRGKLPIPSRQRPRATWKKLVWIFSPSPSAPYMGVCRALR